MNRGNVDDSAQRLDACVWHRAGHELLSLEGAEERSDQPGHEIGIELATNH